MQRAQCNNLVEWVCALNWLVFKGYLGPDFFLRAMNLFSHQLSQYSLRIFTLCICCGNACRWFSLLADNHNMVSLLVNLFSSRCVNAGDSLCTDGIIQLWIVKQKFCYILKLSNEKRFHLIVISIYEYLTKLKFCTTFY